MIGIKEEKKWFYGIEGLEFVWNGEWSDPYVVCGDKVLDYYDIENPMWEIYREECEENGEEEDISKFVEWMKTNEDVVRGLVDDLIDAHGYLFVKG